MNDLEIDNRRKMQLKEVAEKYFNALETKSFSAIPFSEDVVFRAPIAPGGVHHPLKGRQVVMEQWWRPLEPALEGVAITIIDHFYNDSMTGIVIRADVTLSESNLTLRVADHFIINEEGKIIEQENHFDASPLRG